MMPDKAFEIICLIKQKKERKKNQIKTQWKQQTQIQGIMACAHPEVSDNEKINHTTLYTYNDCKNKKC